MSGARVASSNSQTKMIALIAAARSLAFSRAKPSVFGVPSSVFFVVGFTRPAFLAVIDERF
jgi:hypothetical protein